MKLLTKAIEAKLRANSDQQGERLADPENVDGETHNFKPVLKLFTPWGAGTWLLTELDEDGRLYGLCDLGFGTPELGYVSLAELEAVKGRFGLKIERDMHFTASKTLAKYAADARERGCIAA